jgi:hypothetical protein
MSAAKPALGDLAVDLDELTWAELSKLAVLLGMEFSALMQIAGQHADINSRLLATMDLWLKSDCGASWGRVVEALKAIKKIVLAKAVEDKYCKTVETDSAAATAGNAASANPPQSPPKPSSPPDSDSLKDTDEGEIFEELQSAMNHTQFLALKLKIPSFTTDSIHSQYPNPKDRLLHTIKAFLKQVDPEPTWKTIVEALRSRSVNLPRLALELEQRHCPSTAGQPQSSTLCAAHTPPSRSPARPRPPPTGPSRTAIPTLPLLLRFPNCAGSHTNIIEAVGAKYKTVGPILLNDDMGTLTDNTAHSSMFQVHDTVQKILMRWLQGTGREPRTWETLATVLQESGLAELACTIRYNLTP